MVLKIGLTGPMGMLGRHLKSAWRTQAIRLFQYLNHLQLLKTKGLGTYVNGRPTIFSIICLMVYTQ